MTGEYTVLYTEKGASEELFSQPSSYDDAKWCAGYLERKGYAVVAVITAEHAEERKHAGQSGQIEGAHLRSLLNDIVQRFGDTYPGATRETALEAVRFLCGLELGGEKDLQAALLNEIHAPAPLGSADWRTDMQFSIRSREPEDGL